jgi:hypothetical protein
MPSQHTKASRDLLSKVGVLASYLGFENHKIKELVQHSRTREIDPIRKITKHYKQPKRCGIPRGEDQQLDKQLLFADTLHGGMDGSAGVTSFFVRRSVYLAFFGSPHRTVVDNSVMYRVLIESKDQMDQMRQLEDTRTAERQLQEEMQKHEERVQSTLTRLVYDSQEDPHAMS